MKKTKLCAAGLAATMLLSTSALAATDLQKQDADLLNELGLLKGTGSGYALDRTLTRVEGGVMLVRLLGGEKEALAKNYACPFTDVADWAKPYVGWLYHEKLTNGTSATTYVPNRQMTMKEYLWFLGRASGYTDEEIADGKGVVSKASYDAQKDTKINRGQMSALSIDTLYHEVSGGKETLADQLITDQVFTQDQWDKVRRDLETAKMENRSELKGSSWGSDYKAGVGYQIYRTVNGKKVATSSFSGLPYLGGKYGLFQSTLDGQLYYLDPVTLEATKIMDLSYTSTWSYQFSILGRQGDTFLLEDVPSKKIVLWSLKDGVQEPEFVDVDAVSDVSPSFITTADHKLVAFEASGKLKVIYDNPEDYSYSDVVVKGNTCYFIPIVYSPAMTDGYGDITWQNLLFMGGLQVMAYENNQVKTLLSLPSDSKMRLEKIVDIQNNSVTTRTEILARAGHSYDPGWNLDIQGFGNQARVVKSDGHMLYTTDLYNEHPTYRTEKEMIAWWNQTIFGSENP